MKTKEFKKVTLDDGRVVVVSEDYKTFIDSKWYYDSEDNDIIENEGGYNSENHYPDILPIIAQLPSSNQIDGIPVVKSLAEQVAENCYKNRDSNAKSNIIRGWTLCNKHRKFTEEDIDNAMEFIWDWCNNLLDVKYNECDLEKMIENWNIIKQSTITLQVNNDDSLVVENGKCFEV